MNVGVSCLEPHATLAEKSNDHLTLPPLEATPWTSSPPLHYGACFLHPQLPLLWSNSGPCAADILRLSSVPLTAHLPAGNASQVLSQPYPWRTPLANGPGSELCSQNKYRSSQGSICSFIPLFTAPQLKAKCLLSTSQEFIAVGEERH